MRQQQWEQINRIVDTALELEEPKRSTYIEKQCRNNEQLKSKVTQLLESIEKSQTIGFFN